MFKKRKEEEWNPWEEQSTEIESKEKPKKKIFHRKKEESEPQLWDSEEETNYLDENAHHIYTKEDNFRYSKAKIAVISFIVIVLSLGMIGYFNTDFDEHNQGYVVNYDLHYEREYVKHSDELFEYCLELKTSLAEIMPQLATNSLSMTNTVSQMKDTLVAKTNEVSRYTEVPEIMSTYNDNLISFSLSTQKMLATMLTNYTNADYLAWAESAYTDFCNSLGTLEYLRSQINSVIYRNVYGGGDNE